MAPPVGIIRRHGVTSIYQKEALLSATAISIPARSPWMSSRLKARKSGHAMRAPNTVEEKPAVQVLETLSPRSTIRSDTVLLLQACVTFIAVHRDHLHGVTERRFARPHGHSLLGQQECNRISAGWWYCVSGLSKGTSGRQPAPDIGVATIREKRRAGLAYPMWEGIGWPNNSKSHDRETKAGPVQRARGRAAGSSPAGHA